LIHGLFIVVGSSDGVRTLLRALLVRFTSLPLQCGVEGKRAYCNSKVFEELVRVKEGGGLRFQAKPVEHLEENGVNHAGYVSSRESNANNTWDQF